MTPLKPLLVALLLWGTAWALQAAEEAPSVVIDTLNPESTLEFDEKTRETVVKGGVQVVYGGATLTADKATVNQVTGDVVAEGNVRIEKDGGVWTGERIEYNYISREMNAERFRAGKLPLFLSGERLTADTENDSYTAENAMVTSDDYARPNYHIRAKKIKIVLGKYVRAEHATVKIGNMPSFYMPVWMRSLRRHRNYWVEVPGYRSRYGPFLLSSYHYHVSDRLEVIADLDYRQKRGFGYGPGLKYDLKSAGKGEASFYRIHDEDPGNDLQGRLIPDERQRAWLEHRAHLATNLTLRASLKYQSDPQVVRDFFESEYRRNVQPPTFVEIQKSWRNWGLSAMAQAQVNDFFETVERLPDVKLTGLRQQIGSTPFFYESESTAGYLRRRFSDDVTDAYGAMRGDTFHQVLLPRTFFNWLNVTPRAGGRLTYYGEVDGRNSILNERERFVFNTGAEVSTKASRVWSGAQNRFFDIQGLRHIVEPSLNYAYVPSPSRAPRELAQFDYEIASRRLLPIDYPDYNAIDSVDSQNVLRLGLRNKLQTKRSGQVEDFLSWAVYTDWRLHPEPGQGSFSDLFSDLDLAPFRWLAFSSELRYNIDHGDWREANHFATLTPNNVWSLSLGHRYLRDDPLFGLDSGHNLITARQYYRFSENWGFRGIQHFEARDGTMEEQMYSIYRDFRSWTGVISFRIRDGRDIEPTDYTIALVFNFKAFPRYKSGADVNQHSPLLAP